jgi:hypothetical protein
MVMAFGGVHSGAPLQIAAASVTGPDGAVELRAVDNTTPGIGQYWQSGGMVIPVAPLRASSTYSAAVSVVVDGETLTRRWSFQTQPGGGPGSRREAPLDVRIGGGSLALRSASDAPARVVVRRLPSQTVVLTRDGLRADGVGLRIAHQLPGARYEICADQAATSAFPAQHQCALGAWHSSPGLRTTTRRTPDGLVVTVTAGAAAGRTAALSLGRGDGRERANVQTIRLRAFALGELLYRAAHVSERAREG